MNPGASLPEQINQAARILRDGGLIAFPTETYYGLAVDPFNENALQRLFVLKKRPAVKPILVLVRSSEELDMLAAAVPRPARKLIDAFWPGPLTIVFPASEHVSPRLTGQTGTIGVRHSPHPVAAALLEAFGGPLTATSANLSGQEPAASEAEVLEMFGGGVDMILAGGSTTGSLPSTLVGFRGKALECIREGVIPCSKIETFLMND